MAKKKSAGTQSSGGASVIASRSFEAIMMREECEKGFFVAFDYSSDAITEVSLSRFFKQSGKVIIPLTAREIVDEEIARKLA